MKKTFYCLAAFLLLISSCIPSLHPIYTDDTLIIEDNILGKWESDSPIDYTTSFTVVSDELEDKMQGEQMLADLEKPAGHHQWFFEQASEIAAIKKDASGETKIDMKVGSPSMLNLDDGWEIKVGKKHPYYILTHNETVLGEKLKSVMLCHLTIIGKNTFVNFFPFNLKNKQKRTRFATNFVSAHTFAKVNISDDKISIQPFDVSKLESLLKAKRIRLKYEKIGDRIILTASTQELRSFLEKYGDRSDLYDDEEILDQVL
jgi:hypothetical protein